MCTFQEKAARITAVSVAQQDLERTRRVIAMLGALGLGIGLGVALSETRNPWVIGGLLAYSLALAVESIVLTRQTKRSMAEFARLTSHG